MKSDKNYRKKNVGTGKSRTTFQPFSPGKEWNKVICVGYMFLLYKLECFIVISTTHRSHISTRENYDNFKCV